jgi:ABC-type multidrug transport system fused ATPase/permease subunit
MCFLCYPLVITIHFPPFQQCYIDAARELQRLIGISRAPVIQYFAESISGSNIIRSFEKESQFINSMGRFMDNLTRPSLYNAAAMEWLCFRLDMLSSFIFSFALMLLISLPIGVIDPSKYIRLLLVRFQETITNIISILLNGNIISNICTETAGLAVTYGLSLNMLQGWAIAILCSLENRMISVERMLQYTIIPSEPPLTISESRPNCLWPTNGEIELRNLHVCFSNLLHTFRFNLNIYIFRSFKIL